MCRSTHPLAAIGTMSWPHSDVQRPGGALRRAFPSPFWNHLMAETTGLEASVGRDHRKLIPTSTYGRTWSYPLAQPAGLRCQKAVGRSLGFHVYLRRERLSHCHQTVGG